MGEATPTIAERVVVWRQSSPVPVDGRDSTGPPARKAGGTGRRPRARPDRVQLRSMQPFFKARAAGGYAMGGAPGASHKRSSQCPGLTPEMLWGSGWPPQLGRFLWVHSADLGQAAALRRPPANPGEMRNLFRQWGGYLGVARCRHFRLVIGPAAAKGRKRL